MLRKLDLPILRLFGTNWITFLGANITTISAVAILGFLILGILGLADSPYIALMALLVLPGVFIFGLLLIPIGLFWERRRRKRGGKAPEDTTRYPVLDLNRWRVRRTLLGVIILTVLNVLIISVVSYEGVVYMDSTEFCGQVCHTVMDPEYTTYLSSPHSRVHCVECHIGPGAPWFVRSKLSGLHQVVAVTLDNFQRPIPTPIENLRPSQIICEQCHWPGKFTGDRIRVITRFSDDEANTPLKTVLALHIGGGDRQEGIHSWHISGDRQTSYIASDRQRQQIPWIQVHENGEVLEFKASGQEVTEEMLASGERRVMDCVDCHNRPTHVYQLPADAMDKSLAEGRIDASIPFIKKVGVEVLTDVGETLGAPEQVVQRIRSYYRESYQDFYNSHRQEVEDAVREIESIYRRNVHPEMKLTWGTYTNNIGHQNFPGCFRCHDGEHETDDGRTIEQDCEACHTILAWDEQDPDILQQLGIH